LGAVCWVAIKVACEAQASSHSGIPPRPLLPVRTTPRKNVACRYVSFPGVRIAGHMRQVFHAQLFKRCVSNVPHAHVAATGPPPTCTTSQEFFGYARHARLPMTDAWIMTRALARHSRVCRCAYPGDARFFGKGVSRIPETHVPLWLPLSPPCVLGPQLLGEVFRASPTLTHTHAHLDSWDGRCVCQRASCAL